MVLANLDGAIPTPMPTGIRQILSIQVERQLLIFGQPLSLQIKVSEFPYGDDPRAIWEGDNRSWHTPADFNISRPRSSRVRWSVNFDTDDLSTVTARADTDARVEMQA
jgi:hypothetical protein